MRTLPAVAILAFLPLAVHPAPDPDMSRAGAPAVMPADSTSVPLELPEGRAVVAVSLDGRGPYRLAVETGSPNVLLSPRLVADLRLRGIGPGEDDSLFRLDSLRIGGMLVRSLAVGRDAAFASLGVDGVLGLDAFADLLVTVDYPARTLALSKGRLPKPDGREVLRAVRVGPFVGIEVDLNGVKEVGVIDTQGGIGFQALPAVAGRLKFEKPPRVVGRAVVGGGAPVEVLRGRLAGDARIGRHVFARPYIAVHPLPPDIPSRVTLGLEVLSHFAVTLDQRSMAVRLARADTSAIAPR